MIENTKTIVVVEHPHFGIGKIVEIELENPALISVEWENGEIGSHRADELEFMQKNEN